MSQCPFSSPGHQVACLALMKQREEAMTRPYDPNPCYVCPQRVKRLEAAKPPQRIAVPKGDFRGAGPTLRPPGASRVTRDDTESRFRDTKPAVCEPIPPKTEPIPPKEETRVVDEKAVERVLSRILREGSCSRGRLMNYCAVSKGQLEEITAALVAEGKIKAWPQGRGTTYTPPGAEEPAPEKEKPAGKPAAPVAPPTPGNGGTKPAPPVNRIPVPTGTNPFAYAIDELVRRKESALALAANLDKAIETLRAIA